MKESQISPVIREKAPLILALIKKAKSILLHCHPSPDPDSVGSALAMKFALEQMGKKAVLIKGDSAIPIGFRNFPGAADVVQKNFGEVDLSEFELFIAVDSAVEEQISRYHTPKFPLPIKSVVIDHHPSNKGFADLNLIDPSYPATAQILYELFILWDVKIDEDIAKNLFVGIYSDTGGFEYSSTKPSTLEAAADLAKIAPDYHRLISDYKNSNTPQFVMYEGLALASIETFHGDKVAISSVKWDSLKANDIPESDIRASEVAAFMRTVSKWDISIALAEIGNNVRVSSRTLYPEKYDLSLLMTAIGGGGHKAAAAASVKDRSLEEIKKILVAKAKELYNL